MMRGPVIAALACLTLAACMGAGEERADGTIARAVPAMSTKPVALQLRDASRFPPADATGPLDDPLTCLARTVYWEAKGEPLTGQSAVAHVVLNRVNADAYPSDVCGVVTQGGPARPCQFSFFCDGRDDTPVEADAYRTAHRVAWEALNGQSDDPTRGATSFHNLSVRPGWATANRRTTKIGHHVFYR
ncbi:cell wall hydrolase [Limibaculum sp. M0105]|uniref:Cell wall hydrolase n=1 Tax=Thermohalobaculum xanthum TaxID=2753746 RepID=A0A8J7M654_9RHOB|nr:cell wall hydrolase [Thermohalobaculum xanthum]MBK0398793.1 cell wall hydrolase [Thermohalobaculum xanthum]